jgi:serine/threonine-protein kinase
MAEKLLYENPENGVSITYPSGWLVEEPDANDDGIVVGFLAPGQDVSGPEVYVFLQMEMLPSGQEITLDQYGQAALSNLQAVMPDLQVLAESDIPMGGQKGHAIVYELKSEGESYRVLKAWSVAGDTAYIFTYNAPVDRYEEFAREASQIIGSLKTS